MKEGTIKKQLTFTNDETGMTVAAVLYNGRAQRWNKHNIDVIVYSIKDGKPEVYNSLLLTPRTAGALSEMLAHLVNEYLEGK